jgi:hypothetical protein
MISQCVLDKSFTVTFESFVYAKSCLNPGAYAEVSSGPTEPLREWMNQQHQLGLSKDKVAIVVHLPNGFREQHQVCVFQRGFYDRYHEGFIISGISITRFNSMAGRCTLQ